MTVLGILPPAFLLPAWNASQIAILQSSLNRRVYHSKHPTPQSEPSPSRLQRSISEPIARTFKYISQDGVLKETPSSAAKSAVRLQKLTDHYESRLKLKIEEAAKRAANYVNVKEAKHIAAYNARSRAWAQQEKHLPLIRRAAAKNGAKKELQDTTHDIVTAREGGALAQLNSLGEGISGPPQRSLLEELFPEEAAKINGNQQGERRSTEREGWSKFELSATVDQQDGALANETNNVPIRRLNKEFEADPVPVLLILENALPNLSPEDFKRITPKGKHISDWRSVADPIAIIPARNGVDVASTGKYYLIFQRYDQAKAWQERALLLHNIARQNAPRGIDSPVVPHKGFMAGSEDIGEVLREYALCAYGAMPKIAVYGEPQRDSSLRDDLVALKSKLRDHEQGIVRPGSTVLFWLDDLSSISYSELRHLLSIDGANRRRHWVSISNHDSMLLPYREKASRDKVDSETSHRDPKESCVKWTIILEDEAEARRFIRSWHMRPYRGPAPDEHRRRDRPLPSIRTKLLW